jgi:dTDP-4-amino-4,6-dideoxygalactose transaminase
MWHLFPIKVKREKRTEIFNQLRGSNIGVQVNYLPAHLHPVFSKHGFKEGDFPISEEFYSREISLPMMASNSDLNKEYFQKIARILQ